MPLLTAKKEVYAWLKDGKKTIDVRKGRARRGEVAVFQCGPNHLRFPIVKRETGSLTEVVRNDNYKQVIPTAICLEDAILYFHELYGNDGKVFTAYYLKIPNK